MALTDIQVRTAKPLDRDYKLYDSAGMFLLVTRAGGKLWKLKYTLGGKEKRYALGTYPMVSLKEAREKRDAARKLLDDGKDPSLEKKRAEIAAAINAANTFKAVAEELIGKLEREGRKSRTMTKQRWFLSLLEPHVGSRPIAEIEAFELLAAIRKYEAKGLHETASRLLAFSGRVFRYAIATTRARYNPAADLRGALTAPRAKHHAAILDPAAFGGLLRAIDGFEGQPSTMLALKLAPHVFVRPGELRQAEWAEIDLDKAIWKIPGAKMKMRDDHVVPLSRQAIAILEQAKALSGRGRYVFPGVRTAARPMSENTLNAALRRLGYASDEMTSHGFRSSASTLLNESGLWNPDAIERALAHGDQNQVRAAYHRGAHWQERVKMAQWWSDHLDDLRLGCVGLETRRSA